MVLKLEQAWPCRRKRWWALLIPTDVSLPQLVDLPFIHTNQSIAGLLKVWPRWSDQDERALASDDQEIHLFSKRGADGKLLDLNHHAPTLLHSLGAGVHSSKTQSLCRIQVTSSTLRKTAALASRKASLDPIDAKGWQGKPATAPQRCL